MVDLNEKIAIIGAGPSGLSAAYYLKQKGYKNLTILEKEERIGGKCCSFSIQNKKIDLGAALISPSNTHLLHLFKVFKAKVHSQIGHHLIYNPIKDTLLPIEKSEMLTDSLANCLASLSRFIYLSNKYRYLKKPGYAHIPEELFISFESFIAQYHLEPIKNLFIVLMTHMGYGKLENIPAYMAIKFLKIRGLIAFFTIIVTGKNYFKVLRLVDGFQSFWEKLAQESQFSIVLKSDIKAIEYQDNGVVIHYQNQTAHFNQLIVATPLDKIIDQMVNPMINQHLVKKIHYLTYVCHLFRINALHSPTDNIFVMPPNLEAGPLMVVACPGIEHTYTCYSANERQLSDDQLKAYIVDFLCQFGIRKESIEFITIKNWHYFPHVSIEAAKEGFYKEINAAQGKQNTYYVGDLLSFESVEQCVSFSKYLVDQYF